MPTGIFKRSPEHLRKINRTRKPHSDEAKRKIGAASAARKRKPHTRETRAQISRLLTGKKQSRETLKKRSLAQRGSRGSNWRGGITPLTKKIRHSFQYRQWRSDVFTRDDFTCQECDTRGAFLNAHHAPRSFSAILAEEKIRTLEEAFNCSELWNINNGVTLCTKCHEKKPRRRPAYAQDDTGGEG